MPTLNQLAYRDWPLWAASLAVVLLLGMALQQFASVRHSAGPDTPAVQRVALLRQVEPPPQREMAPVRPPAPMSLEKPAPAPPTQAAPPAPRAGTPEPARGLDAPAGQGANGYGLAALPGHLGAIGGDAYGFYARLVQRDLRAVLNADTALRRRTFSVVVKLWLDDDGHVSRGELATSSGDAAVDRAVLNALTARLRVSATPPAGLPQPIKLAITSRS